MTLLNTVANIGHNWPQTAALYLIDVFTFKQCIQNGNQLVGKRGVTNKKTFEKILNLLSKNTCSTKSQVEVYDLFFKFI